jgi:hypothetical protein
VRKGLEGTGPDEDKRAPAGTRLVAISAMLIGLTVIHDLDHVRQGRRLQAELYVVAVLALVSLTTTLVLLLRRHPMSELAAIVVGLATVLGVAAVHVAPRRSLFSDSYPAANADLLSWAIIILMMLFGVVLALESFSALRRRNQIRGP